MKQWFTPADLAALALPGMPTTARAVQLMAQRENWKRPDWQWPTNEQGRWRRREARGGGVEYHYSLLPTRARAKVVSMHVTPAGDERAEAKADLSHREMWTFFDALPDKKKEKAREKLAALDEINALIVSGMHKDIACQMVATQRDIAVRTVYNWRGLVAGKDRADWLPYLAPRHVGTMTEAHCDAEAWEYLKGDYLRLERPNFSDCYRRLTRIAQGNGWSIPSDDALLRRIQALPTPLLVLARDGVDALKRMFPAQERDRSVFHALEAVNADGHKWDVWVRWPDGDIGRPVMVGFQDLYSGMILSWRIDRTENKETVRLALGDLIETYGIPDHCWLDNGRNFASKWLTGGIPNRYRFKVRDEEPAGILTTVGTEVHWTTPYSGQSKPIERAWRDMAQSIAKDPRFAGAWTGNTVADKPENYGSKAVDLDTFIQVVSEGIAEHNARLGRTSRIAAGRSLRDVFTASYEVSPIRKATPEQRRLWLLAAEGVRSDTVNGSMRIEGNRYWAEFLHAFRGQKLVARFDPQSLHDGIHIYRLDGAYVGYADCIEAAGFNDVNAARSHAQTRRAWMRAQAEMLKAERKLSIEEVAAMMPTTEEPAPLPETKLVRPVFGNLAIKPETAIDAERDQEEVLINFGRGLALVKNNADL